jgi:hypothetical protein
MATKSLTLAEQFAKLKEQRSLMVGLLFLLVIVVFWIGLGLFSSQQKFAVPKELRDLAKPLTPTVDEEALARVEKKQTYSDGELASFTIYKVVVAEDIKQLRLVDITYQEAEETAPVQTEVGTEPELAPAELTTSATPSATPSTTVSSASAQPTQEPAGGQQSAL